MALRTAVGFVPILGPATDVLDTAASGDRIGTAIAVGRLLVDLSGGGGASGPIAAAPQEAARHVAKVLKHTLKQKAKNRVRELAVKVSLTAVAAAAEAKLSYKAWRRLARPVQSLCTGTSSEPAEPETETRGQFSEVASGDAQAHALFAKQVYVDTSHRRGVRVQAMESEGQVLQGDFWYAYVGGDSYRGFWYCPAQRGHLVLAERGTCTSDLEDLGRDACIAIGKSHEALQSRAQTAQRALLQQLHCHGAGRVTATGHSLGGATVARLARLLAEAGMSLHRAHVFNPGGLPDAHRYLSLHARFGAAPCELHVHRIVGDVISLGFLPLDQQTYSVKQGLEDVDAHRLLHFLPPESP